MGVKEGGRVGYGEGATVGARVGRLVGIIPNTAPCTSIAPPQVEFPTQP